MLSQCSTARNNNRLCRSMIGFSCSPQSQEFGISIILLAFHFGLSRQFRRYSGDKGENRCHHTAFGRRLPNRRAQGAFFVTYSPRALHHTAANVLQPAAPSTAPSLGKEACPHRKSQKGSREDVTPALSPATDRSAPSWIWFGSVDVTITASRKREGESDFKCRQAVPRVVARSIR